MNKQEVLRKLVKRLISYSKFISLNVIQTDEEIGFFNFYKYPEHINTNHTNSQWIIDMYVMTFHHQINKDHINNLMDLLRSTDEDNQLIGLNGLYNLDINNINFKLYENG